MNIKRTLKNSDYWTWFTEWLLAFGGKAAWPVLIVSTLYMGAELYPGVNLPSGLNFAVFLAQLFALDMGGMGLVSIARQVKSAGHEQEAKQADSFGRILVAIMITSLVTVGTKQFLGGIPALTAPATKHGSDSVMNDYIDPAITCVEFILVIARIVCAVLYGKVMHALKVTEQEAATMNPPVDSWAVVGLIAHFEQLINSVVLSKLKEVCLSIERLKGDTERRFQSTETAFNERMSAFQLEITESLSVAFSEAFQSIESTLIERLEVLDFSQQLSQIETTVTEQITQVRSGIEEQANLLPRLIEPTSSLPQRKTAQTVETTKTERQVTRRVERAQASSTFDKTAFIEACLTEDPSLSIAVIQARAEKVGQTLSIGTVSTARKAFNERQIERRI